MSIRYKVPALALGIPASAYPEVAYRTGAYDWVELLFDKSTQENVYFDVPVPDSYDGTSISLVLRWRALTLTTGDVRWSVSYGNFGGDSTSWSAAPSDGPVASTVTVDGTAGDIRATTLSLTGASGYTPGTVLRVKLSRMAAHVGDTLNEDAALIEVDVVFSAASSGGGGSLNGVTRLEINQSNFTFSAGLSTYTVTGTPNTDSAWSGLYTLEANGIRLSPTDGRLLKRVSGAPANAGEWRINGTTLQVYGDMTGTTADWSVTYPV